MRVILGSYWDNGKENGNYYSINKVGNIGIIWGIYYEDFVYDGCGCLHVLCLTWETKAVCQVGLRYKDLSIGPYRGSQDPKASGIHVDYKEIVAVPLWDHRRYS